MIEQGRRSNDTESEKEKENETHTKSGHLQSGVWKYFDRGESNDDDGHWEGTCQYCKKILS